MSENRTQPGSARRRGTSSRAQLTTIYWRDIPAQVRARAGRDKVSIKLGERFQTAIDAAATRAGKTAADDYLAEWREENSDCGENLELAVEQRRNELETAFTPDLLRGHVTSGGWAPD
jgi:Virulence factor